MPSNSPPLYCSSQRRPLVRKSRRHRYKRTKSSPRKTSSGSGNMARRQLTAARHSSSSTPASAPFSSSTSPLHRRSGAIPRPATRPSPKPPSISSRSPTRSWPTTTATLPSPAASFVSAHRAAYSGSTLTAHTLSLSSPPSTGSKTAKHPTSPAPSTRCGPSATTLSTPTIFPLR